MIFNRFDLELKLLRALGIRGEAADGGNYRQTQPLFGRRVALLHSQ